MLPNERFALACRAYYEEQGLIVDETNGEFAHCPYPEGMCETGYYLLHDHHQQQGILQSKDVGKCCFFPADALEWLRKCDYFPDQFLELWDIYTEYASQLGREAAHKTVVLQVGVHGRSPEKMSEDGRKGWLVAMKVLHSERDEFGRSVLGVKNAERLNAIKDEEGKSVNARRGSETAHKEKDELGRSILGVKNAERMNAEKNEEGKSVNAVKGAQRMNELLHADRDEFGRSIFALQSLSNTYQDLDEEGISIKRRKNGHRLHEEKDEFGRSVVAMKTNNQVWESTVDGHRGNSSAVARHNRAKGWDPKARIRIS
jgi:hypothetical protein